MVSTPVKVLLFLGAGVVAAGGVAYVSGALDPLFGSKPADVAAVPDPATADQNPDPAAPKDERLPGAEADAPPADGVQPPAAPAAASLLPTFDLLRVEPDGSMVIAGKAAADVTVEALTNDNPIGKTQSEQTGDFAIVLDEPLKPGDYQIKLRSTDKAGVVSVSEETATVSVPSEPNGQVLAMVEAPGQASEIITAPQPDKPADAAAAPADEKPADTAAAPAEEKPADTAAAPAGDKPADTAQAPAEPAAPAEDKPAAVAAADPAQPAGEADKPAAAAAKVVVEAVEIEGTKVFVAGAADPNFTVRVYANEIHLGDTKSSAEGRFLIEAERDLPVGNYIIRADLLGADGTEVVARAAVPFEREPGDIAAVAPDPNAPKPAAPAEEKPADVAAEPAAPAAEKPADVAAAPSEEKPADTKPADVAAQPAAPAEEKPADVAAQPAAPAAEKPADTADSGADAGGAQKPADVAAADVTQPPLQAVDRAVIIRRGDSLWRISRRAYGRGVRYSTLYLANQDQIQDPNRIWPGQVFKMPEKTSEGEAADWDALGDQITTKQQ